MMDKPREQQVEAALEAEIERLCPEPAATQSHQLPHWQEANRRQADAP